MYNCLIDKHRFLLTAIEHRSAFRPKKSSARRSFPTHEPKEKEKKNGARLFNALHNFRARAGVNEPEAGTGTLH